jgi:ABC-type transporter Mla subunit MlaD
VAGYLATGGTQRAIARAISYEFSSVSRYLSGERVLPAKDLPVLRSFLTEQGHPLDDHVTDRLEELCRAAHAASGSPAVQLEQTRYDLARLTEAFSRAQAVLEGQAARLAELEEQAARLSDLKDKAARLTGQLAEASERIEKQNQSLDHARGYIQQTEAELTEQRKQTHTLRREVEVLREQNRRLIEEPTGVAGVSPPVDPALAAFYAQVWAPVEYQADSSTGAEQPASVSSGPPPYEPCTPQPGLQPGGLPPGKTNRTQTWNQARTQTQTGRRRRPGSGTHASR